MTRSAEYIAAGLIGATITASAMFYNRSLPPPEPPGHDCYEVQDFVARERVYATCLIAGANSGTPFVDVQGRCDRTARDMSLRRQCHPEYLTPILQLRGASP